MIVTTEAIVLKSFDFRETSRIATFFTRDFGKVKGVLKGIRKDPRKFGSSVDRFTLNDIVYYQYRNSDIHLVSHCDMKDYYTGIRGHLKKMTAAHYAMELIDTVMPVEQQNAEIYQLLREYLITLQTAADISKIVHMFQIKVLLMSGFRPHLESCLRCQRHISVSARFSLKLGGLVCNSCQDPAGETIGISQGAVASILHVQQMPWIKASRLLLSTAIKQEMKYILNHFLVFHLDRHLRSTRFLT